MGVYGGVTAEDRRAGRRERLLDAALDLLGTDGASAATVRGVCAAAGLTPRYFYESFSSIDELLVAVFDRIAAEALPVALAAADAAPHDARAKARAALGAFAEHLLTDQRRARVAFVEALGSEALMRRRLDALRGLAALLADRGREFYGAQPGTERLVDTTAYLLVGGVVELFVAYIEGDLEAPLDELLDDLTELFVAVGEAAAALGRRRMRGRT